MQLESRLSRVLHFCWRYRGWSALAALLALAIMGVAYQSIGQRLDMRAHPPAGELVPVGGDTMHIWGTGHGHPTIVFSQGLRSPSAYVDFYPLTTRLGRTRRVVVYDRLGHGWSSRTSEPRDIDRIVEEIHQGLARHGETPPYLFVAHSAGTLEAIRFAERYPDEVIGLVSLDGGSPEYYAQTEVPSSTLGFLAYSALGALGIARIAINHFGALEKYVASQNGLREIPLDIRDTYRALAIATLGSAAIRQEASQLRDSAKRTWAQWQVTDMRRRLPLRILTAEASVREEPGWLESQRSFAAESVDGVQITLRNTRHSMQHFAPDEIARIIDTLAEATERQR